MVVIGVPRFGVRVRVVRPTTVLEVWAVPETGVTPVFGKPRRTRQRLPRPPPKRRRRPLVPPPPPQLSTRQLFPPQSDKLCSDSL